ncbi:MAG: DUF4982 domain-containing protein [Kiritimatiellae bacterium]|nr:DUF4982 domain-containing protein [Kiritimatiellia bacterium]
MAMANGWSKGLLSACACACVFACAAANPFDAPERNARNFNAGWTFAKDGEAPRAVDLPHDWAVDYPFTTNVAGNAGRLPYPGHGVYRKSFALSADDLKGRTYLEIDGAMCHSSVRLNGKQVSGDRPYGYASYSVELTEFLRGAGETNDLEIVLDTPPRSSRYYSGAGLYRDVRLVTVPKFHVAYNGVRVRTKRLPDGRAEVLVDVTVEGAWGPRTLMMDCHVFKDGKAVEMQSRNYVMPDGRGAELPPQTVTMTLVVDDPEPWSPETPNLYDLEVEVLLRNVNYDRTRTRFGIRTVEFRPGEGFFLNGKRRQMKGACLHHDFGPLGGAFHVDAARRQLKIMKEMGADAIRTTHNPPDPKFLDLCDEMGFMVMDEAFDMWELRKTDNDYHVEFPAWHERDLADFVKRDRNHPCVMLWSIGNEVQEHTADPARGYRIGTNLTEIVGRHDDRPTTVACWCPVALTNGMQNTVKVFGGNYIPWYYEQFIKANPDKCIIGTETESVLSSRGVYFFPWPERPNNCRKDDPQPFFYGKAAGPDGTWGVRPETYDRIFREGQVTGYDVACYQADLNHPPDTQFKYQELNPSCCGMFTWTGVDYLGEPTPYGDAGEKARSAYFGACDLCGFPKDRFWLFRSNWLRDVPTAHLLPHWNWKPGMTIPVHLYSSGDEAELFVNGKSQGVRKRGSLQYRFTWDAVAYEPGAIKAVVKKNGKAWAMDEVKTAGAPAKVVQELDYRGGRLCYWKFTVVDENGVFCPTAAVKLSFKGDLAGVCNGDPTDWTPFKSAHVTTFNGLAQAITRGDALQTAAEGLPVERR